MSERLSKSAEKRKSPVPDYIFDKTWREGNFLIPENKEERVALRQRLDEYSHYGIMHLPENKEIRKVLLDRIAALEAYDYHGK
ncbi:MAG: hypothetical protein UY63_C0004G0012 [Parcubacteria group bacterium GW2011_GWA2_51_10]|nr:MAG: hypothetical protein UY63_C0004G0012 [Parcubacteria group bacterium GW2011_GWA2_51_10]